MEQTPLVRQEGEYSLGTYRKPLYGIATIVLFLVQLFASRIGRVAANLFSYEKFDPYNLYAWLSVHHTIQMLVALALIVLLSKRAKIDFGFRLGDTKKETKYLMMYTGAFAIYTLVCHVLMRIYSMLPTYNFPLNSVNVLGTLGFQLFLSGTSEEILFRVIPITLLVYAFGEGTNSKRQTSLETIIASCLFSIAHITWSLSPFTISINYWQLFYAFVLGVLQGRAYQRSHSVLYPMLMHSISNVLMVGTGYIFALF